MMVRILLETAINNFTHPFLGEEEVFLEGFILFVLFYFCFVEMGGGGGGGGLGRVGKRKSRTTNNDAEASSSSVITIRLPRPPSS